MEAVFSSCLGKDHRIQSLFQRGFLRSVFSPVSLPKPEISIRYSRIHTVYKSGLIRA